MIALPQAAVLIYQELWYNEQRYAFDAFWSARNFGQYQVDNVFRQIMVTGGNEYLLAGDGIAAVLLRFSLGTHQAEVGATMRFGQIHRAGPFTADEFGQIGGLLIL